MKNFEFTGETVDQPHDECGVVGIWAPGEPVAALAYTVLNGLQHRGESAAGIFVHHAQLGFTGIKGNGRVPEAILGPGGDVSTVANLDHLTESPVSVGHVRYSTSDENSAEAAQPFKGDFAGIALSHNGHVEGLDEVGRSFGIDVRDSVSDSHKLTRIIDFRTARSGDLLKAVHEVLPSIVGAYCITVTDGERLIAARDPWGLHPLALGAFPGGGHVVASEAVVFDTVGAQLLADIEPGEVVAIDDDGPAFSRLARQEEPRRCAYEFIYTGRIDGEIDGVPVYDVRHSLGQILAEDYPVDADVVVGMPESGLPAAFGYAEASGLPLVQGVTKNPYSGRSFLQRGDQRSATLVDKARVVRSQVEGRRVVVVDDSMIKGNSMRANVAKFYAAGAREVHVRIAAPTYENACYMGMDTGNPDELIARNATVEQMCAQIGADSLAFITPERVQQVADREAAARQRQLGTLCMACSTGEYPFARPASTAVSAGAEVVALGMPQTRRTHTLPIAGV